MSESQFTRRGFCIGCSAAIASLAGSRFNSMAFAAPGAWNSDEILIVLDGVDTLADAVTVAETVRSEVRVPVETDEGPMSATISIGVVLARPDEPMDSLLARADQAMYQAKLDGRDRVVAQG